MSDLSMRDTVRKAYGDYAATQQKSDGCCQPKACCSKPEDVKPVGDLGVSCGDPAAFGYIQPGDVVLDLGSGAGRDVFQAARHVGAGGRVIGVDMTPEMLTLAEANREKLGLTQSVEFRQGYIEALPVADASVDVILSNCVINLSPDKAQVFREAFRVLRPGGRLVVSDVVLAAPLPESLRNRADLYCGCLAGALQKMDYLALLSQAGFQNIEVLKEMPYRNDRLFETDQGPIELPENLSVSITYLALK